MRTVVLENMVNGERVECEDLRAVQIIDGVEYVLVRKPNAARTFMMRKDVLKRQDSVRK